MVIVLHFRIVSLLLARIFTSTLYFLSICHEHVLWVICVFWFRIYHSIASFPCPMRHHEYKVFHHLAFAHVRVGPRLVLRDTRTLSSLVCTGRERLDRSIQATFEVRWLPLSFFVSMLTLHRSWLCRRLLLRLFHLCEELLTSRSLLLLLSLHKKG